MKISKSDLLSFEKDYRTKLVNSISGLRSPVMIGTKGEYPNLAVFYSLNHIGSNPPLLSIIFRPLTVERHTYDNIKANGLFTINHITDSNFRQAHQTCAKYNSSEFDKVGLTPEYHKGFDAPFVKESPLQIGLKYVEEHTIAANGCILLIGEIQEIYTEDYLIKSNGEYKIYKTDPMVILGLNKYFNTMLNGYDLPYPELGKEDQVLKG